MKKIALTLFIIAMLLGCFSACAKTEDSNKHLESSIAIPSTNATEATEPPSSYKPGKWTVRGYTSEWLNMSYDRPGTYTLTDESIEISKTFDAIRLSQDPYFAVTEMYYKPVFDIKYAPYPITLTVALLENRDQTSKVCADKEEEEYRRIYMDLGSKILDEKETELVFLGETYVVRYSKVVNQLRNTYEYCRLYLVKEDRLVVFTYAHLTDYFFVNNVFYGFSSLDGSDYKGTCSVCPCDVPYKIVSVDEPMCLRCYFETRYVQDTNNNQVNPTEPESTTPTEAPTEELTVAPTEASTTAPTAPPAPCSHNYTAATCTAPKTCTLCGQTIGSALGHTYSAATCTTTQTCNTCGATSGSAAGHKWTNITQTVHHEEQGHYEQVQESRKVAKIKCACGNKTDTTEEYYEHFKSAHGNDAHYAWMKDRFECVSETVYETVTKWIVDKGAYTEAVVTGRKCDVCGKEE